MKTNTLEPHVASHATRSVQDLASAAADKADLAIDASRRIAGDALDSLQSGADTLRHDAPSAFARAAARVEALAGLGLDRCRETGLSVKDSAARAGERSIGYVRDEPVKSMLIAAASGAAVAALVAWLVRSRSNAS